MMPPDQRLDADHPATGDLDLGLVVQDELGVLDCVAELALERLLLLELEVELLLEQAVAAAAEDFA